MSHPNTHHIWAPETGITDLPEPWRDRIVPELVFVRDLWQREREAMEGTEQLASFGERLAREWAIETGLIENLYELDRGVTQTLIEVGFQSALIEHGSTNKPREYVIHLLEDQKEALEGLFAFVKQERELTTSYIKELQAAITRSQIGVDAVDAQGNRFQDELLRGTWKIRENFPMKDGVHLRYCPPEQTASEMDRLVSMHAEHGKSGVSPEVEAAWLHHRFTQIHPFQDGNGRVARSLASLVFMQAGLFPLVVTRDDKVAYLDALERADTGDLGILIRLFSELQMRQFRRAVNLAEKIQRPPASVDEALLGLTRSANASRQANGATAARVIDLRDLLYKNLISLAAKSAPAIRALGPKFGVQVKASGDQNSERFLEVSRFAGGNGFGVLPVKPLAWTVLEFRVPVLKRFVFQASGVDPKFDGFAQVIAFTDDGSRFPPVLSDEPLEWYPRESEASMLARLDDWVEQAFIRALEAVRAAL